MLKKNYCFCSPYIEIIKKQRMTLLYYVTINFNGIKLSLRKYIKAINKYTEIERKKKKRMKLRKN